MTNKEATIKIREWLSKPQSKNHFSWPTDACSYEQHIKFVTHRNLFWNGGSTEEFMKFVKGYTNQLEEEVEAGTVVKTKKARKDTK